MYFKIFWFLVYNTIILIATVFLLPIIPFKKKLKEGFFGRAKLWERLENFLRANHIKGKKRVWFHVASAGEFEQALPVMAELKKRYPNIVLFVTFFSPSGKSFYEMKKPPMVDFGDYAPLDFPVSVVRFLNLVKPDILVLSKYDIWPNMVWFAWLMRVKILMVNGSLKRLSRRFNILLRFFYKSIYSCFHFIGTIDENDAACFREILSGSVNIARVGDTKYDRVLSRKLSAGASFDYKNDFFSNIFIMASVWQEDEAL